MASRVHTPTEIDAALSTAIAAANGALGALRNGPLMDARSELCWTCSAAAACSIDEARSKIAAAMEDLRQALISAGGDDDDQPMVQARAGWHLRMAWKRQSASPVTPS